MDEKKIYANQHITETLQNMRQASFQNIMPLHHILQTVNSQDILTLVHHNTEGLPSQINDMKSHHGPCLADILCLTETHLHGSILSERLSLEGYTIFHHNRHLSYTKFPQIATKRGGGVDIYAKSHVQARQKQFIHNVTDLEFVVLKLKSQ